MSFTETTETTTVQIPVQQVLDILEKQLDILKLLSTPSTLIPGNSRRETRK